jgi:hypothetical protein
MVVGAAWALQDVSERDVVQDRNCCYEMIQKMLKVDDLNIGFDFDGQADAEIRTLATEPGV